MAVAGCRDGAYPELVPALAVSSLARAGAVWRLTEGAHG